LILKTPLALQALRTPRAHPTAPTTPAIVLIADDESSMRLLVHVTIESSDYTVLEAEDGDQAWAMIQKHKPALVILDIQMPGRNGLEILGLIKSDPSLVGTRVILLTAKALEAELIAGMTAAADFMMTKPFSPLDLVTRVEQILQR
jgi:two-component system phosphate regulon response regulator PhoB